MKKILKMTLKENKVKKKTESFTKTNENPTEKNVVENKKQKSGIKKSRSIVARIASLVYISIFATVILMIITITYKAVLVAVGVWLMLFDRTFINERLDGIRFVFYLGIILNIICIAVMLILVFNNRLATNICSMVIRVLERLHIMKSDNQRIDRLNDAMEVYRRTAAYLKKHVLVVAKVFVITILQRTAYFFTTYFIYRSFGLKGTGMYTVVMLQAVISLSVDMLPLPGGMGISEALFRVIYLPVFGSNLITAGLVLSRSVSFYTELFVSAVFTMFAHIYIGRFTKKEIVGVDDFNIDYR